jgi:hypothetical protein
MKIRNKFIVFIISILIPLQSGLFAFISLYFRSRMIEIGTQRAADVSRFMTE